jgi:purine-binding chemotaxis protein CheW
VNSQSYLTFRLHELIFGIETLLVKEVFQLPELKIIPETPGDILGVLYLRDRTIPVMHLDRRLGQPVRDCQLSDRVIVIQWENIEMGVIVDRVLDVVDISSDDLEPEPDYGRENHLNTAFIANIATFDERSIILLNPETLIRQPEAIPNYLEQVQFTEEIAQLNNLGIEALESASTPLGNFFELYCPQATEKERALFRQRAKELQLPLLEAWESEGSMALAVFRLGEEYFSCDLALVREFIDIETITSIPCCPSHIVGNINLRGEIVTVVDIRFLLHSSQTEEPNKAIVVQIDDLSAAIVVDEIFDVFNIDREQLSPVPTAVATEIKPYIQGMAIYEENLLSTLDLARIFAEGNLVVG